MVPKFNPHIGPFLDTHIISLFGVDTITYTESTKPPKSKQPIKKKNHRKNPLLFNYFALTTKLMI